MRRATEAIAIAALLTLLLLPAGSLRAQPRTQAPAEDVAQNIPDPTPDSDSPTHPSTEKVRKTEPARSKPAGPSAREDVFVDRNGDGIQDGKRHRFRRGCKRRKGRCGCSRWRGRGWRWHLKNSDP